MYKTFALGGLMLLGLLGTQLQSQEARDDNDAASLQGRYRITAGQEGTRKIPADELKPDVVHFEQGKVEVYDKAKKHLYAASYKLDTSKKPWVIHMTSTIGTSKPVKSTGLIQKDGDTVKLIYALPGGETPTSFEPAEKQNLFVMRKQQEK